MFRSNRVLAALVLALSLPGCASLPGSLASTAPAAADEASVKVTIGTGYHAQAFPDIALTLRLELPWAPDPSKRVQVVSVTDGVPFEFKNLPTGYGTLTAIATNTTTKAVVDKQSRPIQLKPGYQAQAYFNLVVGGSSALDLNVDFHQAARYLWDVPENDGLDDAFRMANLQTGTFNFVWSKGGQSAPVVYTYEYGNLRRRIADGPEEYVGYSNWLQVPTHAVRVDSDPLGTYQAVRHYRWENVFNLGGTDQTLVIDRWLTPTEGLLKEEVSQPTDTGPVTMATLVREGL